MRLRLAILLVPLSAAATPSPLYDRYCLACHGAAGDGHGPAAPFLSPPARDFTTGRYKWRTTSSGQAPTDADLARVLREGAPGTSMPGFEGVLDDRQISALVDEIKRFAPDRFREPARPIALPGEPTSLPDGAARFADLGCAACHGPGGRGDGGVVPRPYDLTRAPLRRGRTPSDIATSIRTGLDGTTMPGFPTMSAADLWALARFVRGLRVEPEPAGLPGPVPAQTKGPLPGFHLEPQGPPPPSLPPAAASLSADQCARCHAKQHREWRRSLHARALSPGVSGQLHGTPDAAGDCLPCHAPLAEQRDQLALRAESVSCAGCHLRAHVRNGPSRGLASSLLPIPSYPWVADPAYERADFCLPCHQLGPEGALAGRPTLDTYREWLTGPYMRRGVQCQHCHMPDREHSWKGIHDPETVRQGLRVTARRAGGAVEVHAENVGAGHDLPTTPTPAIFITVEPLAGGLRETRRIGRQLDFDGRFHERADTRLAPGAELVFSVAAGRARVRVTVAPDDYYERFFRQLLAGPLAEPARRELQAALDRAASSRYLLYDLVVE